MSGTISDAALIDPALLGSTGMPGGLGSMAINPYLLMMSAAGLGAAASGAYLPSTASVLPDVANAGSLAPVSVAPMTEGSGTGAVGTNNPGGGTAGTNAGPGAAAGGSPSAGAATGSGAAANAGTGLGGAASPGASTGPSAGSYAGVGPGSGVSIGPSPTGPNLSGIAGMALSGLAGMAGTALAGPFGGIALSAGAKALMGAMQEPATPIGISHATTPDTLNIADMPEVLSDKEIGISTPDILGAPSTTAPTQNVVGTPVTAPTTPTTTPAVMSFADTQMDTPGPTSLSDTGSPSAAGTDSTGTADTGSDGNQADGDNGAASGNVYAAGGLIHAFNSNTFTRRLARGSSLIGGSSMGRGDKLHVGAPRGGYIVPADVVSGLGQGNTAAGGKRLAGAMPKLKPARFASGGVVPIRVSSGEFFIHPRHVAALGGAAVLDHLVSRVRAGNAHQAVNAAPPQ
jgi:hypothetical protein